MRTEKIVGFRPAERPVTEPVTKFGGQPVWLGEPAWPVSEAWDRPMRFVCQVALTGGRLASVFVTHADHDESDFSADGRRGRFLVQDS